MKVDYNIQSPKSNPQFGRINLYGGAGDVVKRVITKQKDIEDFGMLVAEHIDCDSVDINFFAKGSKSLCAKVCKMSPDFASKEFSPRLFESPISFIKRVCAYGKAYAERLKSQGLSIDDIIKIINE